MSFLSILTIFLAISTCLGVDDVSPAIKSVLALTNLQGQGAAATVLRISSNGTVKTLAVGAGGQRRMGYRTAVLHTDLFDVASCGKSFTSAVWGVLVTKGLATWTDTIGTLLGRAKVTVPGLQAQYAKATLAHLLSHRAGFADDTDTSAMPSSLRTKLKPNSPLSPTEQRRQYALYVLAQEPSTELGEFSYSNEGYNIASWLAEAISGTSFEDLIRTNFFKPLKMTRAGFGLPYEFPLPNRVPRNAIGHDCDDSAGLKVSEYDWEAYASFGLGSGGLYMTISDLARWVAWHVKGVQGLLPSDSVINRSAFQALHKPWVAPGAEYDGNYAKGWVNDTLPVKAMYHDGAYAGFRTYMIGITQADAKGNMLAVAVTTNVEEGDSNEGKCAEAVDNILTLLSNKLIDKYYKPGVMNGRRLVQRRANRRRLSTVHL